MAETNGASGGHTPAPAELEADAGELEALLAGLFEPTFLTVAPGRVFEIRPLLLHKADPLYAGGLAGAALQRFLIGRCVYLNGRRLGMAGADRLPVALANKLVPVVMSANGMATGQAGEDDGDGAAADPKA